MQNLQWLLRPREVVLFRTEPLHVDGVCVCVWHVRTLDTALTKKNNMVLL